MLFHNDTSIIYNVGQVNALSLMDKPMMVKKNLISCIVKGKRKNLQNL